MIHTLSAAVPLLTNKRIHSLMTGLPWVLALAAGAHLANLARSDFSAIQVTEDRPMPSQSIEPEPTTMPRVDASMLIHQSALFGVAKREPEAAPVETRLDLNLIATFTHANPEIAMALISQQGSAPEPYRIGDTVGGDGALVEIRSGSVVLNRNNRLEALHLEMINTE